MNRALALASAISVLLLMSLALFAQYQVNRQIYGNAGPSPASVRYAPQYLGATATAMPSSVLLPSEVRNAYVRSGALPSDIRMGYNAIGPLAPGGAIAYIPKNPPIPRSPPPGPTGNAVNPMLAPTPVPSAGTFVTPSVTGMSGSGSIRYDGAFGASPPVSGFAPSMAGGIPTPFSDPIGGGTLPGAEPLNASIHYNR